jgi:hypothetical protein
LLTLLVVSAGARRTQRQKEGHCEWAATSRGTAVASRFQCGALYVQAVQCASVLACILRQLLLGCLPQAVSYPCSVNGMLSNG